MDDGSPELGVGFAIETSGAFAEILRFAQMFDDKTAEIVRQVAAVEAATGGMIKLSAATAEIKSFGSAATRELRDAARETGRVEKAGEAMVRQLERQSAAFGKTREEMRGMKAEAAALAAEQQGLTELAGRIRDAEGSIYDKELAAARKLRFETEALAQEREQAMNAQARAEADVIMQLRERAKLEAALARIDGTDRPTAASAGATFSALAERERAAELADRETDAIRQQNSLLAERANIQAAIERNTGLGRPSASEAGATYSALAARAAEEEATALREATHAYNMYEAAAARGAKAARDAEAAQAAQASSLNSLRSSIDPLYASQQRLSRELESAVRLYRAGAIGQEEYEHASSTLAARLGEVQRAQARANQGATEGAREARLGANDLVNVGFQLQDIFVSLAGGQNPFLVLIQQGSQLGGIMAQTGVSASGMAKAVLGLAIVTTPTAAASAALAAAQAAVAGATTAASAAGTRAAIASAELAVAEEAATLAGTAGTAAQHRVALAQAEVAATAGVAAAAVRQLAAAEAAAAGAGTAAAASATAALAPWLAALLPVAAAVAAAAVAIKLLQNEANDGRSMKAYATSLGLTAKEVRNLDDVTVTFGDTAKAVFQVVGAAIWSGIGPSVIAVRKTMEEWLEWIKPAVKGSINLMIGGFVGAIDLLGKVWQGFPPVVAEAVSAAANSAIDGMNNLIKMSVGALNGFIASANGVLGHVGIKLPDLSAPEIKRIDEQHKGAAQKWRSTVDTEMKRAMSVDYLGKADDAITARARKNARDRIKAQAFEKGYLDPEKPKTDKHAEQLVREAAAIEAQIKNLYLLADAYRVSGAEALIAEAHAKAESAAIKKRGEIDEFVARQVRLSIAQRVVDSAKSSAGMHDQAVAQEQINAMVAAGLVPAERAADLVRDRIADLPILASIEAAQKVKDAQGAAAATRALEEQRAARERLTKAESDARYNAAMQAGGNRLEELREELRLIDATDEARARGLAVLRATQETSTWTSSDPAKVAAYIKLQGDVAAQAVLNTQAQDAYNDSLNFTADKWDIIAGKVQSAAAGMADALGTAGRAIGDMASIYAGYTASRERAEAEHAAAIKKAGGNEAQISRENARFALRSSGAQIEAYGDMVSAAKGFFKEGSAGYRALAAAEKAYRIVQFAMSVQAMIQNAAETLGVITGAAAKATAEGAVGVAKQSQLPFPANIAAMAATAAALVAAGVAIIGGGGGGGGSTLPKANDGTGTVLGDAAAKSESINRALDQLRQIDTLMLTNSRQMLTSLRSIDQQIGGLASVLVRSGNINADDQVATGFKTNAIGSALSKIPLIGGILGSLFGTKTSVLASGIYGVRQSIADILGGGFDAQTYSDVEKKKKFLGITTSTKYSTQYGGAVDSQVSDQFALILRSFNDAIVAAAGPLGQSTADIAGRVSSFVFDLGKIDLKGLTGTEIQEKLTAVFGAAADSMASAAFPGIERLQKVGEGAFETLVRVASTVETVTAALDQLGTATAGLGIDAKVGLADQFDSLGDLTSAVGDYFNRFYTPAEQNAPRLAQLGKVFVSMNLSLPETLAGFRALVEAQDLNTDAGRAAYATLLQLAPAFADLKASMDGAKSAADILGERQDLQRKLLELAGDTAAIRARDLAKLDASNRALQMQVWAVQDAQDAAKAAQTLADTWTAVGTSIGDEIKRIRGLSDTGGTSFAALQGQFNAAAAAARGGDMDAAKLLPALSQSLLKAAADAATSRQELARVQAMTAASLEVTNAAIAAANGVRLATAAPTAASATSGTRTTSSALLAAASASQATIVPVAANDGTAKAVRELRQEVAQLRAENNAGHAATAGNTGRMDRRLENVTAATGGEAISVAGAA